MGAHLVNSTRGKKAEVFCWLERNQEVDFVLRSGKDLVSMEVKSWKDEATFFGNVCFCRSLQTQAPDYCIAIEAIGIYTVGMEI